APSLGAGSDLPATLDAWLDPPDYTGMAPIYLGPQPVGTVIAVPAGSQLLAQVQGGGATPAVLLDGQEIAFTESAPALWKAELTLQAGQQLSIEQNGDALGAWTLQVLPDQPPTVGFREPPAPTERQA